MRTQKRNAEKNTNEFLTKNPGMSIYYENVDFLTVRIVDHPESIYSTLNGIVENSDTFPLDHGFKIQFFGLVAGSQLKVLHLLDSKNNLLAYVHIKQPTTKKNKNFQSDIEFVGLFWTAYGEYFDYICDLFQIDPDKKGIVSRIDYCFDIKGLKVGDLMEYTADKYKKSHVIRYGDTPTYTNNKGDRHELCLYDKKLDILEKNKHKIRVADTHPYSKYLKETEPITRIEYRKKSRAIKEIVENSCNGLFLYIRKLASEYIVKMYDIDFPLVLSHLEKPLQRLDRPKREDAVYRGIAEKKAGKYLAMSQAYAENYCLLRSEHEYFKHLVQTYGTRLTKFCTEQYLNGQPNH